MSQLLLKRLRFSKEADTWLRVLKSRTGVTPNLLCRMAFCLSLADRSHVETRRKAEESDREINRYTLLGEYDAAFVALLRQWMQERGIREDSLDEYFSAHVHRGIVLLAARLKALPEIVELSPRPRSPKARRGVTTQAPKAKAQTSPR